MWVVSIRPFELEGRACAKDNMPRMEQQIKAFLSGQSAASTEEIILLTIKFMRTIHCQSDASHLSFLRAANFGEAVLRRLMQAVLLNFFYVPSHHGREP